MERTMSVEERIKRAEERYNMKNGQNSGACNRVKNMAVENAWQDSNLKNISSNKKNRRRLLMQIFVCLVIYIAFYAITNREYIFSESFKNDVNVFFTEKTKLYEMYSDVKLYIDEKFLNKNSDGSQESNAQSDNVVNTQESNSQSDNVVNSENSNTQEENNNNSETTNEQNEETSKKDTNNEDLGGSEESISDSNVSEENDQMQKDADKIKSMISFINPLEGRISSTFGWRNPTVSTVPKYHTGLDIAAVSGTVIKSATDGKVILASSEGDYGNHYQIQIKDVVIIYAHCQKLYLNEGDTVVQGQEIAEVGSTGNSTGPHLHFEIRIEDRRVDPQLILDI